MKFLILFLVCLSKVVWAENFVLDVIHINDFHARFDEINSLAVKCKPGESCIGGLARTITTIKKLQSEAQHSLYLNAGDNYQGTLWYDIFKWNVTVELLNLHKADAMTLGNHEFDDRVDGLLPFLERIQTKIVISNIDISEEPRLQGLYEEYLIVERGDRKIGIIGLLTATTPELSYPEKIKFLDEEGSVRKWAPIVRNLGADIVIVLSHCGITKDKRLADAAGEHIDLIVGGHSHSLLYNGNPPEEYPIGEYPLVYEKAGHKTLIVQAFCFSKYVGHLRLEFDGNNKLVHYNGNPVFVGADVEKDPEIEAALIPWKTEVDRIGNIPIGRSLISLDKNLCNLGECSYGNLINDAYVYHYTSRSEDDGWTYTSIGITNAGIIRVGLGAQEILYDDLATSHPYQNTVDTFELSGRDLLTALEISASNHGTVNFLQFSGLKVVYDMRSPVGARVKSANVKCRVCEVPVFEPLNPFEFYRISIASWIGDGGNGYTVFAEGRRNHRRGPDSFDVLRRYVEKVSPIVNRIDGRIQVIQ